jgi:hypothetical protein
LNNVIIGGQAQNFSYTVIIIDTNAAPFFTSVPTTSTTQDAGYRYAVVADDLNLEDTSLTIATSKLPDWLKLTDRGDGTATLEGTPTNSDVGEHFVELQVTDSSGLIGTQAFSVTVANVNDAPALISTPIAEAEPEILYSYGIVATDPDLIWGDTLSITTLMLPDWLTLTDMGDGTAVLVGTPENDDLGRHPVELRVTDSNQLVDKQSFSITVRRRILLPLLFRN